MNVIIGIICSLSAPYLCYASSKINAKKEIKAIIYILSLVLMGIGINKLTVTNFSIISWLSLIVFLFLLFTRKNPKSN